MAAKSNINEVDAKILRKMLSDSRTNFVDMAKEFGLSKNTVWNRFQEMKKTGLINGSTVQINYRSLGYDCVASILLQVDPPKTRPN